MLQMIWFVARAWMVPLERAKLSQLNEQKRWMGQKRHFVASSACLVADGRALRQTLIECRA